MDTTSEFVRLAAGNLWIATRFQDLVVLKMSLLPGRQVLLEKAAAWGRLVSCGVRGAVNPIRGGEAPQDPQVVNLTTPNPPSETPGS